MSQDFSHERGEFFRDNITVFRGLLPDRLIIELRRVCENARDLAYTLHGPSAQRLEPLSSYTDRLNMQPFLDYVQLPELKAALGSILQDSFWIDDLHYLGVLIEPKNKSLTMPWHQDMWERTAGVRPEEFAAIRQRQDFGIQVNVPLYQDSSLWYVRGSAGRAPSVDEIACAQSPEWYELLELMLEADHRVDTDALELATLHYVRSMAGAEQFQLLPGDVCIYRPFGWHTGVYSSYRKRATLHHGVWTDETFRWWKETNERRGDWFKRYESAQSGNF